MQWVGPLSFALCPSVGILPGTSKGSAGASSIAWSIAACCLAVWNTTEAALLHQLLR